ncbi:DMT family transporter [Desulfovibrio mangrovi]|uniref:DMT family transporter n=1 Tax=Desulfovibrio mangrovi TaxID=2976983 RepID=UPI0022481533|nr:DMT family transporter [Desulfovibrio mangrovi]UZP67467.1 DMT family transporter [Desulfovibrio mangrovi]
MSRTSRPDEQNVPSSPPASKPASAGADSHCASSASVCGLPVDDQRRNAIAGILFALCATVIWSGNFIVARGLCDIVPPATLAFLRWITAFLFLLPIGWKAVMRERKVVLRRWKYLTATAFLGITIFNTLVYAAGRSTAALNMSLIAITSPLFIMLLARIFLGEKVTTGRAVGVSVVVCGVLLLVTRGDLTRLAGLEFSIGDVWMLCAAMLFGAYTILVRRMPERMEQAAFLLVTFGLGAFMLIPLVAWEQAQGLHFEFTPSLFAVMLYVGVGASLISFWCWNKAVSLIGPSQAGIVYYSLPLFCGVEAVLLLGEPVSWVHFASGALILGGIRVATRS